jgi:hypothetical protein
MNTDQDIAELKECQRRLEAKINALVARTPVLRKAMEREHIDGLRARANELNTKAFALRKGMTTLILVFARRSFRNYTTGGQANSSSR